MEHCSVVQFRKQWWQGEFFCFSSVYYHIIFLLITSGEMQIILSG